MTLRDLGPLAVPVLSGYWLLISGVIAVSLMPSAWPMSLGYLLSGLGGLVFREQRYEFAALGNLIFCIWAVHIYRREGRQRALGM